MCTVVWSSVLSSFFIQQSKQPEKPGKKAGNPSSEEVHGGPASPEEIEKITAEMTQQVG